MYISQQTIHYLSVGYVLFGFH